MRLPCALPGFYIAAIQPASLGNHTGCRLMVAPQVKIEPGRALIEFPHARWNTALDHGVAPAGMRQASVRPHPNAIALRIDFTLAAVASATGAVAHVFGAPGLRTQETHMLNAAIPAPETVKQEPFDGILHCLQYNLFHPGAIGQGAEFMKKGPQKIAAVKEQIVGSAQEMKAHLLHEG